MNLLSSLMGKHTFFRSKVARRIFVLFILCTLIPLSALAYFAFSQVTKNLYSQANEDLHVASKAAGMLTFQHLQFLETDLGMVGAILGQGESERTALSVPGLRERLRVEFKSIVLTTGTGRMKILLGKRPVIPQLTKDEQDHVHTGKTLVLTRLAAEKHVRIYMVKAVSPPDASRDVIFGEIDPEYLWGSEGFLSPQTELFVLDQSHNVLFSSFPEYTPLQEIKNAMQNDPSIGRFTWAYGNKSFLASYWDLFMVPRFHANWIVAQSQAKTDILAPIGNFRDIFLFLVLLTFLTAVFLSLIQIRRSLVPIELLREATRKFGEKKFESRVTIRTNDEFEELGGSFNEMAASLENYLQIMTTLNRIGLALSAEKSNNRLLELILLGAKTITHADGCAFYAVTEEKQLKLSAMHVDSINLVIDHAGDVVIPLYDAEGKPDTRTALAFSKLKDVTVNIPDIELSQDFDFSRTRDFDKRIGYRSRSLLCVPVKNHENETVGVLLLINAQDRLSRAFVPFSEEDQRLLETLASQAAVALSKNKLIEDFSALFDSLVELLATVIDKKSPYTGSHCRRVPELTMMLAEAVSGKKEGVFGDFTLSEEELHELKIAALLHDCGKVSTPVHISDKATRLETIFDRIHLINARFEVVKRDAQIAFLQNRCDASSPGSAKDLVAEQEAFEKTLEQIERDKDFVRTCNSGGTVMDENRKAEMERIARNYRWINADGKEESVLSEADKYMLTSSARGTLTPAERAVINQHVETTIKMLESLPYPKSLRNVPAYAQAHHERMDGKGYPKGLTKKEIPLQGRIIAIADIFEAMTARDRPYKKGKTLMEALSDLGSMKQEGHIDPDLFNVFINEKVYLRYAEKYLSPAQIDEIVLSRIPGYEPPSK